MNELTPQQTEHWEHQLNNAERSVEVALRMLGRLPIQPALIESVPPNSDQLSLF